MRNLAFLDRFWGVLAALQSAYNNPENAATLYMLIHQHLKPASFMRLELVYHSMLDAKSTTSHDHMAQWIGSHLSGGYVLVIIVMPVRLFGKSDARCKVYTTMT